MANSIKTQQTKVLYMPHIYQKDFPNSQRELENRPRCSN